MDDKLRAALLNPNADLDAIITAEVIRRIEADPEFQRLREEERKEMELLLNGDPSKARPMGVIYYAARK